MPLPRSARALLNATLAVAAIVAFVLLAARPPDSPGVLIEVRDPPAGIDEIRVHVGGAVASPGVVVVQPGDRVADAVERAGGATDAADLAGINLARRVVDQDQIVVPEVGAIATVSLVDLNRATSRELEALPGIGPARAGAIIASRSTAPFTSSDELVSRGLIPVSVYEGLRDLVATPPGGP